MTRKSFFDAVRQRPFGGSLTREQVAGMERILDEWHRRLPNGDERWLAYMLATVFWETGRAMKPVREGGGEAYLRSKRYYPWVGEGLVQVTWEANARKFGAKKPGDLMTWPVALEAMFVGMMRGSFTGRKLSDYFNASVDDPYNARRIINGTDRAELVASFHHAFLAAIQAAGGAKILAKPHRSPSAGEVIAGGGTTAAGGVAAGGAAGAAGAPPEVVGLLVLAGLLLALVVFLILRRRS